MDNNKVLPEHDSCRTNLLIFFMGMLWELTKKITTLEIATLGAWFYLFERENYFLSTIALVASFIFLTFLYLAQMRYIYLCTMANNSLKKNGSIYLDIKVEKAWKQKTPGIYVSKYLTLAVMLLNFTLLIVTITIFYAESTPL